MKFILHACLLVCTTMITSIVPVEHASAQQANSTDTNSYDLSNPDVQMSLAFVHTLLLNTRENHSHRLNGEVGNEYFIRKQDGAEAVFNIRGDVVTDCSNRGTPNKANPAQRPLAHFSLDVWPWMNTGNCNNAATSPQQRVDGYIKDLREALILIGDTGGGFFVPENPNVLEDNFAAYYLFAIQLERSGIDLYTFMRFDFVVDVHREAFLANLRHFLSEIADPSS